MSRSVSAPSLVTNTSPCWKGFIVPGSTFRYGSSFCIVTRRPRALRSAPRLEAVSPLPREEATPPVTKRCLVVVDLGGMAKRGLPWSRLEGAKRRRPGIWRGAVAAVRGFALTHRLHGLPGYQRPGEARFRPRSDTSGTSPVTLVLTRSAQPRCRERSRRSPGASYPARTLAAEPAGERHHPRPFPEQEARAVVSQRTLDRRARPARATWPFDWRCTWPGASRITHSSETCRPPPWSAGTARSTGCACPASTPTPSSRDCWAPRSTASGGWGPLTPRRAEPPPADRRRYRGDSLILESEWDTPRGTVRVTDFMPPRVTAPRS